jgi:hypothetical protein
MKKKEIKKEDYPMVVDWNEYKNTTTPLSCVCPQCGQVKQTTLKNINRCENWKCSACRVNNKFKEVDRSKYPMVLDWSDYTHAKESLLPCKCEDCGETVYFTLSQLDHNEKCLCKKCLANDHRVEINRNDFPMVLDWSEYKDKHRSKLPCKCPVCGKTVYTTIGNIIQSNNWTCRECGYEKAVETSMERYGVSNPSCSDKIKEKIRQTNMIRYGKPHGYNNDKAKETNQKVYGTDYPMQSEKMKEKFKNTCIEKYGVPYSYNHEKAKETLLKNYGVDNPSHSEEIMDKLRRTCIEKYGVPCTLSSKEVQEKIKETCIEKYGVPFNCMRQECRIASTTISKVNNLWFEELSKITSEEIEKEYVIGTKSYDLKIGNLLIEINPTVSHNVTYSYRYFINNTHDNKPIPRNYHYEKWNLANENGYQLISVFENMDNNKILSIIKSKLGKNENKIGARKCEIRQIEQKYINPFLNENHIQGEVLSQSICLGLYYNNELLQVMTFGKPRFNPNYEWELIRLCTKSNWTVQGGVTKLWNYFKMNYNPLSCLCYMNLNLGSGKLSIPDFKFKHYIKPGGYWVNLKTNKSVTNNSLRMKGASNFVGDNDFTKYSKGIPNNEIMINEGWVEIYDCGNALYAYNREMK